MRYDLDYDTVAETLAEAAVPLSPAEADGLVTALACRGQSDPQEAVAALGGPNDLPDFLDYVSAACAQRAAALASGDLAFAPLLPDEELPAVQRSRALTQWCQGFVTGFALGGGNTDSGQYTEIVDEALADIRDIASASGTASEADLIEIIEYLRVAIQLIYEEAADPGSESA